MFSRSNAGGVAHFGTALFASLMLAIASLSTGCAHSAREIAQEAAPGGLEASIDSLSTPANQEKFNEIAGNATRQVSYQAVLGVRDALRETKLIGPDGILGASQFLGQDGIFRRLGLAGIIAVALALVVLALITTVSIILYRSRRARDQAKSQEADASRIKEVLRATSERPWGKELQSLIEDKLGPDALQGASRLHAGQHVK
jgi:hypothetical protein